MEAILASEVKSEAEIMSGVALKQEKEESLNVSARRKKEEEENKATVKTQPARKRRNRWDQCQDIEPGAKKAKSGSDFDVPEQGRMGDATPSLSRKSIWEETPTPGRVTDSEATSAGGVTPGATIAGMAWDPTTKLSGMSTPTPETMGSTTPAAAYTPGLIPFGGVDLATPTPGPMQILAALTPEEYKRYEKYIPEEYKRYEKSIHPVVHEMFPQERYMILDPMFLIPEQEPFSEQKEQEIMKLLLKVRNGTPLQRKTALRQLTDKALEFGAGPLINSILPLLLQPTLNDQDRHLFKVIDIVVYKLDELVRPYALKIWYVTSRLLMNEDYRVEGREIISKLSKAAGLATMIAALRPDIDDYYEFVRNATARAFSIVASALGIPALLPFLKVVCQSKKSWQARHTGIKIVKEIAILSGCAVLPHLRSLVEIIGHGLNDENREVRKLTSLSLVVLAEAAAPYGIESFDSVLKPLLMGIRSEHGKVLAAFLKAIGFIIPLMDAINASSYTKELMVILTPEFQSSPDEEMKKIVLDVVQKLPVVECDEYDEYDCWLSLYT